MTGVGTSFHELLEELRRKRALGLLRESEEPIESIAGRLGYADPANFRRAFRRWTGLSPSRFRSQQELAAPPLAAPPEEGSRSRGGAGRK